VTSAQAHDPAPWRARREQAVNRLVINYLLSVESHATATGEDFDALEAEKDSIFQAMDEAWRLGKWSRFGRFVWVLCEPGGFLHLRGYWTKWRDYLEQAVEAARKERNSQAEEKFTELLHTMRVVVGETDLASLRHGLDQQLATLEQKAPLAEFGAAMTALLGAGDAATGYRGDPSALLGGLLGDQISLGSKDLFQLVSHEEMPPWFDEYEHRRAVYLTNQASVALKAGDFSKAQRLLRASQVAYDRSGDATGQALSRVNVAILLEATGEYDEAERLHEANLEAALPVDRGDRTAQLLRLKGLSHLRKGELPEAERLLMRSRESFEQLGLKPEVARSLRILGDVAAKQGRFEEARALLHRSLGIEEELENPQGTCQVLLELAMVALVRRDYTEAEAHCARGMAESNKDAGALWMASFLKQRGRIAQAQGRLDAALCDFAESLPIFEREGSWLELTDLLHHLGSLELERGNDERAREHYRRDYELARQGGHLTGVVRAILPLAQLTAAAGDGQEAERLYNEGIVLSRRQRDPAREGVLHYCLARLHEAGGRRDEALRAAKRAQAILGNVGGELLNANRALIERLSEGAGNA
jgi:tetratricopeptide (TPR) repeat protein